MNTRVIISKGVSSTKSLGDQDVKDSPKHKWDLGAAHGHAWGQQSRLDSVVFSLLNKADEMQISHPSARFLLSLCAPGSNLKKFSLFTLGPHADRRAHGSL